MKIRIVVLTSFITTIIVLIISLAVFTMASPTLAQSLPSSPRADQVPSVADAHLALPVGGGWKIWSILGSDMEDLFSSEDHGYAFGCRYYFSAYPFTKAEATIHLPDGAIIKSIRFYWTDWFDANSEVQLRRYVHNPLAFYETLTTLYSSGSVADPLESYTEDASLNILVENSTYIYAVYADLHFNEDDMKVCAIQIGYIPPSIFGAALPVIQK